MDTVSLPHNQTIPILGLGTFELRGDACVQVIKTALDLGYRHIDTAGGYGNHIPIGKALQQVDTPRSDLFVTSKVGRDHLAYDDLLRECDKALTELQLDYLDLYLVHWPNNDIPMPETFRALRRIVDEGKVKNIGVSNFTISRLKRAIAVAEVPIATNQVEYHPYLNQNDLLEICQQNQIALTAYTPIAKGQVLQDKLLREIGEAHQKNAVQVTLRWLTQKGIIAIPKASSAGHMQANIDLFDWALSDEEMAQIEAIPKTQRIITWWPGEFDKG